MLPTLRFALTSRTVGVNMRFKVAATVYCMLFLAAAPNALGQAVSTVQISGVAQDPSGAVVPGVSITATQTATGLTRRVQTDAEGTYVMAQLPIGPYQLTAEKSG